MSGQGVRRTKGTKRKVGSDTIYETVKYILNSSNVQMMSWGTKRIVVDGESNRFPVLVRKVCGEKMWDNYNSENTVLGPAVKKGEEDDV